MHDKMIVSSHVDTIKRRRSVVFTEFPSFPSFFSHSGLFLWSCSDLKLCAAVADSPENPVSFLKCASGNHQLGEDKC